MDNLHFWTDEADEKQIQRIAELNLLLSQIGVTISLENMPIGTSVYGNLVINYDIKKVKEKLTRNAGRTRKELEKNVTPEEVRERMRQGESAEQIAKTLGISRATLFRKLKEAEENGFDYLC